MLSCLGDIAAATQTELKGDPACGITGVAPITSAGAGQLTFLGNPKFLPLLESTGAAAVILRPEHAGLCPVNCLIATDPQVAWVQALAYLFPVRQPTPGIHPTAVVDAQASIDPQAMIGPQVVIGAGCRIAAGVRIDAGCVLGEGCHIGEGSRLHPRVTLCDGVHIGRRVLLHPGVVIGSDGFGLANDRGTWLKVPQLGGVVIGDDVEVGANTAIDRGALSDTVIGAGVKIDNLVQIGHNVVIGEHTAIAGCAVIAGSVTIGRRCMIGGGTAIAGHISIADDVIITGLSGVTNSIREAGMYSGAMTITDNLTWRKNMARFRHLDELARRVAAIEAGLKDNEQKQD